MALNLLNRGSSSSSVIPSAPQNTQDQPTPIRANLGALPPGYAFGLPGITRALEERENIDQTAVTLVQGSAKNVAFSAPFKQSDVIESWEMEVNVAQVLAVGTGTITATPYFPFSFLGQVRLNFQNQFDAIKADNGIDLITWETIRPMRHRFHRNFAEQNPYADTYSAQANLNSASNYTTGSANVLFTVDLPGGVDFDLYFDLEADGQLYSNKVVPQRAFVSPQLMAGTTRIIQPKVQFNPVFGATADAGPYTATGNAAVTSASATLGFQRQGFYQPVTASDTPPIFNWQYVREANQYPCSGTSKIRIPIAFDGQIMSLFYRFFDPSSGAVGAPIPVTNIKVIRLQYGSSLNRFDDLPLSIQRRYVRQHGFLLAEGIVVHDMASDEYGRVTNQFCLNTLDTANVSVYIEFTANTSSTAYVVIGVEGLKYVALS